MCKPQNATGEVDDGALTEMSIRIGITVKRKNREVGCSVSARLRNLYQDTRKRPVTLRKENKKRTNLSKSCSHHHGPQSFGRATMSSLWLLSITALPGEEKGKDAEGWGKEEGSGCGCETD